MGPRLIDRRPTRLPARRHLGDKLHELALRSPQQLKGLERLVDYALQQLDAQELTFLQSHYKKQP